MIVFGAMSIGVHLFPDVVFTEGDSIHLRIAAVNEWKMRQRTETLPKVALFGTSRMMHIPANGFAHAAGLNPEDVINFSRPSADFFFINGLVRKNPAFFENMDAVLIDILPYQVMVNANFSEGGPYFHRLGSFRQKMSMKNYFDRATGLLDPVIPAWSRSQAPPEWLQGFGRISASDDEILDALKEYDVTEVKNRARLADRISGAAKRDSLVNLMTYLYFPETNTSPVQIEALRELRDLLPERCKIVLVWMPTSPEAEELVNRRPRFTDSKKAMETILEGFDEPDYTQIKFVTPEEFGIDESHFAPDGFHFKPIHNPLIGKLLGELYNELQEKWGR